MKEESKYIFTSEGIIDYAKECENQIPNFSIKQQYIQERITFLYHSTTATSYFKISHDSKLAFSITFKNIHSVIGV